MKEGEAKEVKREIERVRERLKQSK